MPSTRWCTAVVLCQVGFIKFVVLPLFETLQYKHADTGVSPLQPWSGMEQPIAMLKVTVTPL